MKDSAFTSSNALFSARCKLYFKAGNKKPKHKPCIGDGDMEKLGEYFAKWKMNPDHLLRLSGFIYAISSAEEAEKAGPR